MKQILTIMVLFFALLLTSCASTTRFGVVSDIHADNQGLEYLLKEFDKQHIDAIIIAGDIVEHFRNNVSDYDELNQTLFLLSKQKQSVFVLPGNHENQADYSQLIDHYKKLNFKITDLSTENSVVFKGIIIIGLPGYENQQFLAQNGFLLGNQRIKSIIDEARQKHGSNNKNNNKILLVSHGPPKGKNAWSIDALADGTNVGNLFLDQIMKQEKIMFSISGHIHEAGQKAVSEDDEIIAENVWSSSLRLNAGSVIAWKMNSGEFCNSAKFSKSGNPYNESCNYSQGSGAIIEIRGEEVKYTMIRR